MAHQALKEQRAALEYQERKAQEGSRGSQEYPGLREKRVTPVKCVQRCPKGSRTLWGSLESQGLKENQVILLQPGRA